MQVLLLHTPHLSTWAGQLQQHLHLFFQECYLQSLGLPRTACLCLQQHALLSLQVIHGLHLKMTPIRQAP